MLWLSISFVTLWTFEWPLIRMHPQVLPKIILKGENVNSYCFAEFKHNLLDSFKVLTLDVKVLEHVGHLKGRSPVWVLSCTILAAAVVYWVLQYWQGKLRFGNWSSVWEAWCRCMAVFLKKTLSHIGHWWTYTPIDRPVTKRSNFLFFFRSEREIYRVRVLHSFMLLQFVDIIEMLLTAGTGQFCQFTCMAGPVSIEMPCAWKRHRTKFARIDGLRFP